MLGAAVGVYLVCVVPHFAGIDEPAHFYRSYQISTGTFVPEKEGADGFGGACIPRDVIRAQRADSRVFAEHVLKGVVDPGTGTPVVYDPGPIQPCPGDPSEGFVTFSTFPSPVPYLPQAASIFVTRTLGFGADVMLIVARFVVLAMYVALVGIAIARSPRSKWALCAAGLMPVAVFQSASSISHDAFTTAVALLVVSSALRALDPPEGTTTRALVIEALVLSAVLGSVKPAYVVIAGLYLLPLLGARRRTDRWPLVFAPVLGAIVSLLWTSAAGERLEDRRRLLRHQRRRGGAEARAAPPAVGIRRRPGPHRGPPALVLGAHPRQRRAERHRRPGDPGRARARRLRRHRRCCAIAARRRSRSVGCTARWS